MNISPKVSVIVPVYNAGKKLHNCLNALQNQTLRDMEFIIVLDCPTDGSDSVVMQYAAHDERFVVIRNEENLHIGESRNRGMSVAKGEYIGFSDHDDDCELDMFEKLYTAAKQADADVCNSDLLFRYEDHDEVYPFPSDFDAGLAASAIVECKPLQKGIPSYRNIKSIWLHLFKAEFLRRNQIRYVDTRRVSMEDIFFCAEVYMSHPRVATVHEPLYHWWQDANSTSHKYSYANQQMVINYSESLYRAVMHRGWYPRLLPELTESSVRRLYTSFFVEWKHCRAGIVGRFRQRLAASAALCEFFSHVHWGTLKRLPLTKLLFYYGVMKPALSHPSKYNS